MSLSQGVMLLHQPAQALLDDMGVDLRGRDVGMAEKLLHRAQIGPPLEQVAGEGMAQHMRRNPGRIEIRGERQPLQLLAETLAGDVLSAVAGGKQPGGAPLPRRLRPVERRDMGGKRLRAPPRSAAPAVRARLCP